MTVNLPGHLKPIADKQVREHLYSGIGDYCVGLILWDIYSRQRHARTGPLLRMPQWAVDNFVSELLKKLNITVPPGAIVPHRFTVRVPEPLYPLAQRRKLEELYRSGSAYITGLVLFALDPDVPLGKGIPHHKLAPLMQRPKWFRDAVFVRLAEDFGNPQRRWPSGVEGRIDELIAEQLQFTPPLK